MAEVKGRQRSRRLDAHRIRQLEWLAGPLSPNGKYVYAVCSDGLVTIDAKTGQALGVIAGGPPSASSLSVSPSGKTLIAVSGGLLSSWDLAAGKFLREVATMEPLTKVICPDDGAALTDGGRLIDGGKLIDLKTGAIAWRYELEHAADGGFAMAGRQVAYIVGDQLCVATLPHELAKKALGQIGEEALLVRPGARMSLDIGIAADGDVKAKIEQAIIKQLQAAGVEVDATSPIKLTARTEDGKTEQRQYRSGGGPMFGSTETVNVTEKITRIYIEAEGKRIWERVASNSGSVMVTKRQGESTQDAVSASNQYNVGFLQSVRIPTILPKPQTGATIRRSQLLATGPKDTK